MLEKTRPPAVAGTFYPNDPRELTRMLASFMAEVEPPKIPVKAIIAPHAGYIYSGPVAAAAYALISECADSIKRAVLIGPAHRVSLRGLAVSSAGSFSTPLGEVSVDTAAVEQILALPQVTVSDEAHAAEHSLEVHLPFLQTVCPGIQIIPVVVGRASAAEVADVLAMLWDGPETIIIVSSDLSHFYDYETAYALDSATAESIVQLDPEGLRYDSACGQVAIQGLLQLARKKGLRARILDLRNSGDTAGPHNRVVGYGAFVFN